MPASFSRSANDPDIGYAGDGMSSQFDTNPAVDQELIADVLLGDRQAHDKLADRIGPVIRAAAYRAPRDLREDLINEVWVHFSNINWRVLQKWDARGPLAHYVMVVARNFITDRLRHTGRPELPIDDVPEETPELVDDEHPERQIAERERITGTVRCVQSAKARLSETHRTIIELRHDLDLTYQEIADRLNRTIGYVSGTLARAERALADKILELCGDHIGRLQRILRRRVVQ
jgi:RNA polymerase sigma-70 factor (ECF subfamily)